MNKLWVFVLVSLLLVVQAPVVLHTSAHGEAVGVHQDFPHARAVVTKVIDGDTIRISPPVCVAGEYRTVIRLADIDAPEPDLPGGSEARNALVNLLAQHGNIVYLDIANYTREAPCSGLTDVYGRVFAVIYVRVNDTHILNVNKWMVNNGYASFSDFEDTDFNPYKWSLYLEYHITAEKLPTIAKVTICENCNIFYNLSWGIRVSVSPDRKYLAVAYSIYGDWRLRVAILGPDGKITRLHVIDGTNVRFGYTDIAANDTGFFITWSDYGIGPQRTRFIFVPYTPDLPIYGPADVYPYGNRHDGPIAVWNPYNNTWTVIYGHQETWTRPRHFINFISPAGDFVGSVGPLWLSPSIYGHNRVGHDILGGLILDPKTEKIAYVARNESPVGTHNLEVVVFPAKKPDGAPLTIYDVKRVYIDIGNKGPEPLRDTIGGINFTRFILWPSIYTKLLSSGRYLLTVYNDTSTSLSYAVIDLYPDPPSVVNRGTLIDRGVSTTFYPWIASSDTHWLVVWSAGGWVNASFVRPVDPYVESYFVIADYNASYVRAAFDSGSRLYPIVYAVTDHTGTRNIYVAFYNATKGLLEPWILPVATTPGVHETPLHVVVLAGSPNRIIIVALEGDDLVAYYVSPEYPELLSPIPIPEPWLVALVVVVVAFFALVMFTKRLVSS